MDPDDVDAEIEALAEFEGWWAMVPYGYGEKCIVWARGYDQAREITGLMTRKWGVRPATDDEIEQWPQWASEGGA